MAGLFLAEGGLSINWWEILIHVFNLIILIVFLKILVYKPVLKMIEKRQKALAEIENSNKQLNAEVEQMRVNKEEIFSETRKQAEYITLGATKEAEKKGKEIYSEAKAKADALITSAEKDITNKKAKMEQEVKAEMAELAVEIAGKILKREISAEDNKKIIDESLKGW